MPTFNDPVADADEVREAARGLAHTTRNVEDPTAMYSVIASLGAALASIAQVLHQLGTIHDRMASTDAPTPIGQSGRAAAYRTACELHRASEMASQVAATVDRAHQLEAAITYDIHLPLQPTSVAPRLHGPSL